MIKILHTADLHIGEKTYGQFDPERYVNTRLADRKRCLDFLVGVAKKERVRAVIIAGDIYHFKTPSPAEEDIFAGFVSSLTSAGIHVVALAGNHERPSLPGRVSPLTHIETLGVERFHLVSEPELLTIDIEKETLAIACIPWPHQSELFSERIIDKGKHVSPEAWDKLVDLWIERMKNEIPKSHIPIIAAHINISSLPQFRNEPV